MGQKLEGEREDFFVVAGGEQGRKLHPFGCRGWGEKEV